MKWVCKLVLGCWLLAATAAAQAPMIYESGVVNAATYGIGEEPPGVIGPRRNRVDLRREPGGDDRFGR